MPAQRFNKLLSHNSQSFTLIELLITIAIIAVLMTVTVVAINPNEMTKKARDIQRLTDMSNLQMIMELARSEGMLNSSYCDGTKIYASLPSETPLSNSNLPAGISWVQVSRDNIRNPDGTGWLPFNFKNLVGLQVTVLPVDPKNSLNDSLYYTFYCNPQRQYIFTAYPESKTFGPKGGKDSKTIADGGPDPYVYEVGNNLFISPLKPVGSWPFEEGGGTIAADSSGNNNNGTLMNGPTWTTGQVGGALSFDGSDDYVDLAGLGLNNPSLYGGTNGAMSFAFWVKPTRTSGISYDSIARRIGGFHYLAIMSDSDRRLRAMVADVINHVNYWPDSNSQLPLNGWTHVVFVLEGGVGYKFYFNGKLDTSVSESKIGITDYGSDSAIGAQSSGSSNFFSGLIDEVRIYNRALSAEEIKRHYEESK